MEVFDITNPLYNENISPVTLAWHFVKSRFHGTMLCVSHVKPLKYITFLAIPLQARTDTISCMYLCISNTQVLKWGGKYLLLFIFFLRGFLFEDRWLEKSEPAKISCHTVVAIVF